ncbi:MAG: hypothetical protein AAGB46_17615 [Verrucomicrobiota bacterium]
MKKPTWKDALRNVPPFPILLASLIVASSSVQAHEVLVIVGAPGEESYTEGFQEAADSWLTSCLRAEIPIELIETTNEGRTPKEQIQTWLGNLAPDSSDPAWVVYIGHGTYSRREAFLNLPGPDLAAQELAEWISPLTRPFVFIHGGSASAPFVSKLSGQNRILVTATQSGEELNYARFGEHLSKVITGERGDVNQDGQVSILEAFVSASENVLAYYTEAGRIATEAAMIDDNGDQRGTPADWFKGTRLVKQSSDGSIPDGFRSNQIALIESPQERALTTDQKVRRDALERDLERLRSQKESLSEEDYFHKLEQLLNSISEIYLQDDY